MYIYIYIYIYTRSSYDPEQHSLPGSQLKQHSYMQLLRSRTTQPRPVSTVMSWLPPSYVGLRSSTGTNSANAYLDWIKELWPDTRGISLMNMPMSPGHLENWGQMLLGPPLHIPQDLGTGQGHLRSTSLLYKLPTHPDLAPVLNYVIRREDLPTAETPRVETCMEFGWYVVCNIKPFNTSYPHQFCFTPNFHIEIILCIWSYPYKS